MFLPLSVATKGKNCDKRGERRENVSYLVFFRGFVVAGYRSTNSEGVIPVCLWNTFWK